MTITTTLLLTTVICIEKETQKSIEIKTISKVVSFYIKKLL